MSFSKRGTVFHRVERRSPVRCIAAARRVGVKPERKKEIMKTLNTKTKRISLIAHAAIIIAGVCVVSHRAAGAEDKTDFLAFGVSTITSGQTARFHAVSVGVGEVQ